MVEVVLQDLLQSLKTSIAVLDTNLLVHGGDQVNQVVDVVLLMVLPVHCLNHSLDKPVEASFCNRLLLLLELLLVSLVMAVFNVDDRELVPSDHPDDVL